MVTLSPVLPIHSQTLPGHNQETYQRLQSALQATPPHQIWIAICDDLPLQRQLAATVEESLKVQYGVSSTQLLFRASAPNLVHQLQDWAERTETKRSPVLQIIGVEQLTYQGADQQYQFLRSLRGLLPMWQQLGCSLLIWLPRPWLKQVKRAVPVLCKTVFEFIGEPTPLSTVVSEPPHQAAFSSAQQWQFTETSVAEVPQPVAKTAKPKPRPVPEAVEAVSSELSADAAEVLTFSDDLWQRLQTDLTRLESGEEPPTAAPVSSTNADTLEPDVIESVVLPVSDGAVEVDIPAAENGHSGVIPAEVRNAWAIAYELRDRVQEGDVSEPTLSQAIQKYQSLQPQAETTPHRTEALNDLGSLYWLWAQHATDLETYQNRLTTSCELYESALSPTSPGTGPDILTRLHSNLGSVYSLLAAHEAPVHCLGKAVRAFHRALQYTSLETAPTEYATLQTHLGTAYWSLAQHSNEASHLHRAITAYQEALKYSRPQQQPEAYGQLQNNLGIALWSLARHERPEFLLKEAVNAYRSALAYRTPETDPAGCAATYNNLGTAYWDLGGHAEERSQNQRLAWQQSIQAYEMALSTSESVSSESLGFDLWATYHSVGVVYDQLAIASMPDVQVQRPCFTKALGHYVKALDGWQAQQAPVADTAFQAIVRNLHLQGQYLGIETQQQSLAEIPAEWLPDIWRRLR